MIYVTMLLNKQRYFGLDSSTLHLFNSYLKNGKQYIEIEEMKSENVPITISVP